jgi:hypothetical protein
MGGTDTALRYTYGPVKQVEAEGWVDSLTKMTGSELSKCDLRMNRPGQFLEAGTPASIALVSNSTWEMNDDYSGVREDYSSLVQTLGGCPDNSEGGRFKIVSVFTTAAQLNYAGQVCAPGGGGDGEGRERRNRAAATEKLLPASVSPGSSVTPEVAQAIVDFQTRTFFARPATATESEQAAVNGAECNCTAEQFARPACFALLSSSEMIFY